jgi:arylsulfatase A-like enzyme
MPEEPRLQRPSEKPNVLVILADQLRRDALGIYGDTNVATPNLDRLAQEGIRFSQACVTSPICVPFRFTLMTGHYAHSRQVPGIEWRMSPAERTLADELNSSGFRTIYVGKWHLYGGHGGAPWSSPRAVNRTPVPREHQGRWQVWRGFELRNDPFDTCYFRDDDPTPLPLPGYQTDALTDLTMKTIREERGRGQPFFCLLSVEPPHPPFVVPEADEQRWSGRELNLPPDFTAADEAEREALLRERRLYYAAVENLDANAGRLLEFLETEGLADDTVVVFLSDHGELGGSHGLREKQYPFEPSIGVPLLVRDPRLPHRTGAMIDDPTCSEDLFPTLLALAGTKPTEPTPGDDLSPLLRNEFQTLPRPGVLLEFVAELRQGKPFFEGGWRGFRTGRYKYTRLRTPTGSRPWHLFDLESDPHECRNLIEDPQHAGLRSELHALLEQRMVELGDDFPIGES